MFFDSLKSQTKETLEKLDASSFFKETAAYLAGGTGLALHLGHRYSYDLDFFTQKDFGPETAIQFVSRLGQFKLEQTGWKSIIGIFEKTKFSFLYYQYPLIKPLDKILTSTSLASLEDIAAMKIAAISDRGKKRDFIDLFFLTKHFPLEKILKFYDQKYKNLATNRTHILRSLIYFADAEPDPIPEMIKTVDWQEVQEFFKKEIIKISKNSNLIY